MWPDDVAAISARISNFACFVLLYNKSLNREVKHDVYGRRQTANGKGYL